MAEWIRPIEWFRFIWRRFFGWAHVKTYMTFASVILSGLALWQSHKISDKQTELQRESLQLQQKTYDRGGPEVNITDISLELDKQETNDQMVTYPQSDAPGITRVPIEIWRSYPVRYVYFTVGNPGTSSIYIASVGIGGDEKTWRPIDNTSEWCSDKKSNQWISCAENVSPGTEVRYAIGLSDDTVSHLDDRWQSQGLEVCVRLEAFGLACNRSTSIALPSGVGPLSPPLK